jgi:hypothetical protein
LFYQIDIRHNGFIQEITACIDSIWCFVVFEIRPKSINSIRSPVILLQREAFEILFEKGITHQTIIFNGPVGNWKTSKNP